ncbi:hypothetical protein SLOPH_743 [Spraguea lophii 42_110]|uniref:Uncharacterized protein n=1 Tax=Spraguea lophii (strain 42_110) TaxID=1358809 RepID=S7XLY2_SPRLO|nr:hypothetical protein SLOPH_743 [Spraguea lophii 42_110]
MFLIFKKIKIGSPMILHDFLYYKTLILLFILQIKNLHNDINKKADFSLKTLSEELKDHKIMAMTVAKQKNKHFYDNQKLEFLKIEYNGVELAVRNPDQSKSVIYNKIFLNNKKTKIFTHDSNNNIYRPKNIPFNLYSIWYKVNIKLSSEQYISTYLIVEAEISDDLDNKFNTIMNILNGVPNIYRSGCFIFMPSEELDSNISEYKIKYYGNKGIKLFINNTSVPIITPVILYRIDFLDIDTIGHRLGELLVDKYPQITENVDEYKNIYFETFQVSKYQRIKLNNTTKENEEIESDVTIEVLEKENKLQTSSHESNIFYSTMVIVFCFIFISSV